MFSDLIIDQSCFHSPSKHRETMWTNLKRYRLKAKIQTLKWSRLWSSPLRASMLSWICHQLCRPSESFRSSFWECQAWDFPHLFLTNFRRNPKNKATWAKTSSSISKSAFMQTTSKALSTLKNWQLPSLTMTILKSYVGMNPRFQSFTLPSMMWRSSKIEDWLLFCGTWTNLWGSTL